MNAVLNYIDFILNEKFLMRINTSPISDFPYQIDILINHNDGDIEMFDYFYFKSSTKSVIGCSNKFLKYIEDHLGTNVNVTVKYISQYFQIKLNAQFKIII